ncbi:hypothetical protein FOL47_008136 [Perkinsus chesapeaki]|uniref:Uncharacterized protein n=1 Tax=Perkinsus chesapeaki TaxID=330153 RepID=A0A7J6LGP5_PERCH|nr:hypothetical protein FOL47_008136 [Perkinsus chesapeaki]
MVYGRMCMKIDDNVAGLMDLNTVVLIRIMSSMNMTPIQLSGALNLGTLGMSVSLFDNPTLKVPTTTQDDTINVDDLDEHFRNDFKDNYLANIKSITITLESELTAIELASACRKETTDQIPPVFPPTYCFTRYEWRALPSDDPGERTRHLDVSFRWRRTVSTDEDITKGERILEAIQSSSLVSEWKQWHEAGISFENLSISRGITELSYEASRENGVTQKQQGDDNSLSQEAQADELTCELLSVLQNGGDRVNADFGGRAKKRPRVEQQERAVRFRGLYAVTAYMDHLRAYLVQQSLKRHHQKQHVPVIVADSPFDGATLAPIETKASASNSLSSIGGVQSSSSEPLYSVQFTGPLLLDNVLLLLKACSEHRRKPFKTSLDCDIKSHFGLNAFTRYKDRGRLKEVQFDPAKGWSLRFDSAIVDLAQHRS